MVDGDSISIDLLARCKSFAQCLGSIAGFERLPIIGNNVYIFLTF